ncbi:hypothetical protein A2533_04640 [Candidatus Falkowbacteria bacterium RIFOXYD2_FULL_35_9]|uniref:Nucleotidyltransferase n=1 Tax=Candidatus Falkowbacteria bacterium RIFOXYC2_FULL_36_12 TaxID=1798002 RepID=A0A1F5T354_9BACT|nr:MAG: hypothetical protein A2478_01615 [Candidatus Falkowbacteria bacterium RIFOXYC2_FULL_36_12]OGF33959.1 MAG: hypothetical protein A2223_03355 [Candidatus Falkowbacteria bacterium RIFOXYA2_FULL_35_8]OGF46061.1 MAG: hypothetical protein A2533_04640 [Candidatus Falkowbacteria bacterium RIFOXYD2_FULL_35_9]
MKKVLNENMLLTEIDRATLRTIVYFDIFDFPLTANEVYKYLIARNVTSDKAVIHSLQNLESFLGHREGFYFLKNREDTIELRKDNYLLSDEKYKLAINNIKLLKKCAFVKAIFITNKLSYSNPRENGDIDIAIVCQAGRIWSCRFFTTLMMKLLGRRPTKIKQKNKICLSFFLDEKNLNLEKFAGENDLHLAFWVRQFVPIFDPEKINAKIQQENIWINKLLPNCQEYVVNQRRRVSRRSWMQAVWLIISPKRLENVFRKIQLNKLSIDLKNKLGQNNNDVVMNDAILKLHSTDRRKYFNQLWEKRCKEIIPQFSITELFKTLINK